VQPGEGGFEVVSYSVEACREAAELFEVCEGTADTVALFVEDFVEAAPHDAVAAGGMTAWIAL
jgi:hypothetical protein